MAKLPLSSESSLSLHVLFLDCIFLLEQNRQNHRVSNAILESMKILILAGILDKFSGNSELSQNTFSLLFQAIKKELFKSKDTKKVSAGIQITVGLLEHSLNMKSEAKSLAQSEGKVLLEFLTKYLIHPFPAVNAFFFI